MQSLAQFSIKIWDRINNNQDRAQIKDKHRLRNVQK